MEYSIYFDWVKRYRDGRHDTSFAAAVLAANQVLSESSCHNELNDLRPVYRQVPDDNEKYLMKTKNNSETLIGYNRCRDTCSNSCDLNTNGKVMHAESNF